MVGLLASDPKGMYSVQDMYVDNSNLGTQLDGYPEAEAAVSLSHLVARLLALFGFWSERYAQTSKEVLV